MTLVKKTCELEANEKRHVEVEENPSCMREAEPNRKRKRRQRDKLSRRDEE